jgi:hypothetical protein
MKELADSNGYYYYYNKISRPSILATLVPFDCVFVFAVNRSRLPCQVNYLPRSLLGGPPNGVPDTRPGEPYIY